MKHRRKVKGGQPMTLEMAQQVKTKNYNVILGQLCCRQCSAKFLLKAETNCIDDKNKVQSVTDTDNEFIECQTLKKILQSFSISPVILYAFMNTIKSNVSEAYKVQVDCLEYSESDSYDENYIKENSNKLVSLHEQMQEKLKTVSYSQQIQILTLVLDKCPRRYCSEYFNVFEYLL